MTSGLGARCLDAERTLFRVWAPAFDSLSVLLVDQGERRIGLQRDARGYHEALIEGVGDGARYFYVTESGERLADPASRAQPDGVHGPSQVIDTDFGFSNDFTPPPLQQVVMYELHVGTFTAEGTFDAAIERLDYLRDLGINAVEVMPVAQFAGDRNWGYDGVFPFAVQNSYGGPESFARFIAACHERGIAVILDVVYNHIGPEGAVLGRFGPYFISKYHTPWGDAINFDEAHTDEVRRYFIENARQWLFEFGVDGLRLDAVHAILDTSAYPFLTELADSIHAEANERGRTVYLIAESDLDDPRMIRPKALGGHGMDAQWADGFHHALHTLLTGETQGYYADYGDIALLAKAYRDGYVFTGQYSAFRRRRHGAPPHDARAEQFIVCIQNHDQVGNRMLGDRLPALVKTEALEVAAVALLTAPFVPLLFMGEEFGEVAPFPYFVGHSDPQLIEAVRSGRAREFESFHWQGAPADPHARATFESARLSWGLCEREPHAQLFSLYRELIRLRSELKLGYTDRDALEVITFTDENCLLLIRRHHCPAPVAVLLSFSDEPQSLDLPLPAGLWRTALDTRSRETTALTSQGSIHHAVAPWSALVLTQQVGA